MQIAAHSSLSFPSLLVNGRGLTVAADGLSAPPPKPAGELWRLARNTRMAADRLALALGELLALRVQ